MNAPLAYDPQAPLGSSQNPLRQSAFLCLTDPEASAWLEPGPGKVWGKTVVGTAFHLCAERLLRGEPADAVACLALAARSERRKIVWSDTHNEAGAVDLLAKWLNAWTDRWLHACAQPVIAAELPMLWCDPLTGWWYETAGLDAICATPVGNVILDWKTGDAIPASVQPDLYSLMHRYGWAAKAPRCTDRHGVDWSQAQPLAGTDWLNPEKPTFGTWPGFFYCHIPQMAKPRGRKPWLIPASTNEQTALTKVRRLTQQYLERFGERPVVAGWEGETQMAEGKGSKAADAGLLAWTNTDDEQSERSKVLIYGPAGAGKTSLCKTFGVPRERVVYIGVDPGQKVLKGCKYRVLGPKKGQAWGREVLRQCYSTVVQNIESIDLLFIDGLDELGGEILREMKKVEKDGRKAYGEMGDLMEGMVKAFRDLPIAYVCFTTHVESHTDDIGRMYFRPTFPGKSMTEKLVNWFDLVGVVHGVTAGESATAERRIQFEQALDTRFVCKFRSQYPDALSDWQPPDMGLVLRRVNEGKHIEAEAIQGAA